MKRFLLSCLVLTFLFTNFSKAQTSACGVTNLKALVTNRTSSASCSVTSITFNLEWDQSSNSGNKFITLHIWQTKNYPSYTYSVSNPPTSTYLTSTNSFGTIVLAVNGSNLTAQNSYDGATNNVLVPNGITQTTNSNGTVHIKLTGITKTFSICPVSASESLSIKADVWASQQSQNKTVQCSTEGLQANLDDPIMTGLFYCAPVSGSGREYDVRFTNNGTSTLNINYNVYLDNNGNGQFDGTGTNQDILLTPTAVVVPALNGSGTSWYSGRQTYLPYSNTNPYASRALLVIAQVNVVGAGNAYNYTYNRTLLIENTCATLPVKFTSFNAVRKNNTVALTWETASEENNKGFYIQRNTGGDWKDVAFVFSAAANGNSNTNLSYAYNDANASKGASQYRILQVDIDGKGRYSEIRSVRGLEQAAKVVVFPNPSTDKINVMFEDAQSVREVTITDIAGRVVKQYRNVTSNSLSIDNLKDGFYNIQVTDRHTGATVVEKAVMKKR